LGAPRVRVCWRDDGLGMLSYGPARPPDRRRPSIGERAALRPKSGIQPSGAPCVGWQSLDEFVKPIVYEYSFDSSDRKPKEVTAADGLRDLVEIARDHLVSL